MLSLSLSLVDSDTVKALELGVKDLELGDTGDQGRAGLDRRGFDALLEFLERAAHVGGGEQLLAFGLEIGGALERGVADDARREVRGEFAAGSGLRNGDGEGGVRGDLGADDEGVLVGGVLHTQRTSFSSDGLMSILIVLSILYM